MFMQAVSDQAVGTGLIRGVKPDQQIVKIVHDELVKLMGGEVSELVFSKSGPTVILLAGLQGVGKTMVCAKLAYYLKKLLDKTMMDELKEAKRVLNPTEVLLVVDAMTGQEAAALVTTFNLEIGITGAILTKLDCDSRGGAALSVKEVSGRPIKLVGCGERLEDLEPFYSDRMAGHILGMRDVLSFKAQEMRREDAEDLQKKIMSAKFDFNDFLKQTRAVSRMGSMTRVIGMIPGMGKVTPALEAEKSLIVMETMIVAMTSEEREQPELLAESPARRKRVAQDSWKTEQQMRVKMKNLTGMMQGGSILALSNLQEALKAEGKAPPGIARRKRRSPFKEAVCRVFILKAKSSGFRVKLNPSCSHKLSRLDEFTQRITDSRVLHQDNQLHRQHNRTWRYGTL